MILEKASNKSLQKEFWTSYSPRYRKSDLTKILSPGLNPIFLMKQICLF